MNIETATVDAEACILSGEDFAAIVDSLGEQQEALVGLMTELDAQKSGLSTSLHDAFELLARIATAVTTIRKTINHPQGRVGGRS